MDALIRGTTQLVSQLPMYQEELRQNKNDSDRSAAKAEANIGSDNNRRQSNIATAKQHILLQADKHKRLVAICILFFHFILVLFTS